MQRRLPDVSTTQLIASGVATLAAAVGASYLGVYGTIVGAAFMSVATTAGSAICKHYLDQGREQIKDLTHLQAAVHQREVADEAVAGAVSADPTRTVVWQGADPNATRLDLPLPGSVPRGGDPNATRLDPNATRLDRTPAETVADALAAAAGERAVREVVRRSALQSTIEWTKHHWMKLVISSVAVFAIVIGGITLFEATTGKPIGNAQNKGLTVTDVFSGGGGGSTRETPTQVPSTHPSTTGPTPSTSPSSGVPSTGTSTGPSQTPTAPTGRPTPTPTTPTPTAPTTPAPTKSGGTGGGQQDGQDGGAPQAEPTP